jgi:hypothetical protein
MSGSPNLQQNGPLVALSEQPNVPQVEEGEPGASNTMNSKSPMLILVKNDPLIAQCHKPAAALANICHCCGRAVVHVEPGLASDVHASGNLSSP